MYTQNHTNNIILFEPLQSCDLFIYLYFYNTGDESSGPVHAGPALHN